MVGKGGGVVGEARRRTRRRRRRVRVEKREEGEDRRPNRKNDGIKMQTFSLPISTSSPLFSRIASPSRLDTTARAPCECSQRRTQETASQQGARALNSKKRRRKLTAACSPSSRFPKKLPLLRPLPSPRPPPPPRPPRPRPRPLSYMRQSECVIF